MSVALPCLVGIICLVVGYIVGRRRSPRPVHALPQWTSPYRLPGTVGENGQEPTRFLRHTGPQKECPACGARDVWVCDQCKIELAVDVPEEGNRHNCKRYSLGFGTLKPRKQITAARFCSQKDCIVLGEHLHQECLICSAAWICTTQSAVRIPSMEVGS